MDVRKDRAFFGREEELRQLVANLGQGKHTLMTGARGVGKSRLMQEAIAVLQGNARRIDLSPRRINSLKGNLWFRLGAGHDRIVTVNRANPMGDCLRELAQSLLGMGLLHLSPPEPAREPWPEVKKQLTKLGSVRTQEILVTSVRAARPPLMIFFDSLDRITAAHQQFLEDLLGASVLCAAVVRVKSAGQFTKIWSSFARIELEPLDDAAATRLIRHCFEVSGTRVVDPELYEREILKSANGNPFQIKNIIWLGSRERHVTTDGIRQLRRTEAGELFNMGPIYILCASFLTLFKIFSFGTDNRDFYIYFSALGFLVYLVFRVFRTFFLFKPQRFDRQ